MPRKLPVRLHEKNGGFYYVFRNKWKFLSRDYAEALRLYAPLIAPKSAGRKPVADTPTKRYNVTLDDNTADTLRDHGDGNLSEGIRRAARKISDDKVPKAPHPLRHP